MGAPRRRPRRRGLVIGVLAIALAIRLAVALGDTGFRPFADAADYDRHAVSLVVAHRYPPSTLVPAGGPTAVRPPAYPYLLAAAYAVSGTARSDDRFVVGRVLGALLGTVMVALVGLLGARCWDAATGLAAMAIAAVYVPFVTVGDALLSDTLFAVLTLGAVILALATREASGGRRLALAAAVGLVAGAATLTRTNGLIVVAAVALFVWTRPRRRFAASAVVVLVAAIVVAPWTVRNEAAFHRLVPLSTQGGFTLVGTYNDVVRTDPVSPAKWQPIAVGPYARILARPGIDEAEADVALRAEVRRYVMRHRSYPLKVAFWNTSRLAGLEGFDAERPVAPEIGVSARVSDLHLVCFYALSLLALAGMLLGAYRGRPWILWVLPAALALSFVFVLSVNTRYRVAIDAMLVLPAAFALRAAAVHIGRRRELRG